ncbi:ATP-binding protein [Roseospira visakhapatnamensis]|uniref:Anti-sigma regulatory factor (Ser/Thr protein kinase) n=1 Tax=Roseospira visakhapatnamensis TaxID=390880 RepID=A0A7W6RA63_9PROT|nr:ATP-binding protein [Roseospira visakhapatnamensis]MBB4264744.1 anti-sigma regulatory factor (Ser/Thr protein kinase) [Roseospira visakhapatnamensis]
MTAELSITLRNDLSEIPRVTEAVEGFGEAHAVGEKVIFAMTLALDEVLTNVITYAFPKDDPGPRAIHVDVSLTNGVVRAMVRDDGRAFDPLTEVPPPDLDASIDDRAIGGLGVHFLRTLMDGCSYSRRGDRNELEFFKNL